MTKQYEFNGTPEEVTTFRVECSRLRIRTILKGTKDEPVVIVPELTDKQHQSIKNLAEAITAE